MGVDVRLRQGVEAISVSFVQHEAGGPIAWIVLAEGPQDEPVWYDSGESGPFTTWQELWLVTFARAYRSGVLSS